MKKEYKEFIINGLYGLIDGSPSALQGHLIERFKMLYNIPAEISVVKGKDRLSDEDIPSWIGSMIATITIEGEAFSYERDWGEEWDVDSKHPDYHSDDWFYEGDKCFSSIKYKEIISTI